MCCAQCLEYSDRKAINLNKREEVGLELEVMKEVTVTKVGDIIPNTFSFPNP